MQSVIGQQFHRAVSLPGDVANRLHEAVLAVDDQLGHAANISGDGSDAARHRFEGD